MRPRSSQSLRRTTTYLGTGLLLFPVLVGAAARAEPLPSLDAAVARARKYAPMVIDAEGQVAVARAAMLGARVLPLGNPQIELLAGQQRTAQLELDAKLYLPVEITGQRAARIAEADRLVDFRTFATAESRARLTGEVTAAWGMAMVSTARVLETRLAAEEAQREVDWVAARQSMGAATVAERSFAEAEIARWFQLGAEAQIALGQAHTRLAQLVALPEVELPAPGNGQAPSLRFASEQALLAHVNETAPLLRSLAAEANYWRASAGRYQRERSAPVSLVIAGGRGDLGEPRVGGGLAWALPAFRRNQGEIGRAFAEAERAETMLAATRDALGTRARGDWRVLVAAREALASLESTGLAASERLVEAANAAWRAGKSELVQVIIARRDLAAARLRRLDLVETIWRIHGDLAALTGELP
jgi:outer membrane protein, heavy metal efflux system